MHFALPVLCRFTSLDNKSIQAQWPHCLEPSFLKQACNMLLCVLRPCHSQHSADMPDGIGLGRGFLESLPTRGRSFPKVGVPLQRQPYEMSSKIMTEALFNMMHDFTNAFPDHTYLGCSAFENNRPVLFSRCPTYTKTLYFGEICQLDATDNSVLVALHPSDAQTVIEAGWAKSCCSPHDMKSFLLGWVTSPPVGLTVVHYPRDELELPVVADILKAAVWWVSGVNASIASDWA